MKKFLTLLFTVVIASALTAPAFAQSSPAPKHHKHHKHHRHHKKNH